MGCRIEQAMAKQGLFRLFCFGLVCFVAFFFLFMLFFSVFLHSYCSRVVCVGELLLSFPLTVSATVIHEMKGTNSPKVLTRARSSSVATPRTLTPNASSSTTTSTPRVLSPNTSTTSNSATDAATNKAEPDTPATATTHAATAPPTHLHLFPRETTQLNPDGTPATTSTTQPSSTPAVFLPQQHQHQQQLNHSMLPSIYPTGVCFLLLLSLLFCV